MTRLCSGGCGTECDERELDADDRCDMCARIYSLRDTLVQKGKVRLQGTQQQLNIHHSQPKEKND